MGDQLGLGRVGLGLQLDEGAGHLAPFLVRLGDHRGQHDGRVLVERVLDLDRGDVLAARDDDVLGAVLELDVAVRILHREVAGMEPAAGEGCLGRLGVLQVALHHDVAAHHDLAHRRAVGRHGLQGVGVADVERFQRLVADALAGHQLGLFGRRQGVPGAVPFVDDGRTVAFGQAIDMQHGEAGGAHGGQDRFRRRRAAARWNVYPLQGAPTSDSRTTTTASGAPERVQRDDTAVAVREGPGPRRCPRRRRSARRVPAPSPSPTGTP